MRRPPKCVRAGQAVTPAALNDLLSPVFQALNEAISDDLGPTASIAAITKLAVTQKEFCAGILKDSIERAETIALPLPATYNASGRYHDTAIGSQGTNEFILPLCRIPQPRSLPAPGGVPTEYLIRFIGATAASLFGRGNMASPLTTVANLYVYTFNRSTGVLTQHGTAMNLRWDGQGWRPAFASWELISNAVEDLVLALGIFPVSANLWPASAAEQPVDLAVDLHFRSWLLHADAGG